MKYPVFGFLLTLILLGIYVTPVISYAHNLGASFEATVNGYFIDIGYEPVSPVAGDRLVLDLSIRDPKTRDLRHYKDAWVRVTSNDELLVATGVSESTFGPTTLLLRIPDDASGPLKVSVRFENADKILAETEFTVQVTPNASNSWLITLILAASGGVVLGWFVGYLKVVSFFYARISKVSDE